MQQLSFDFHKKKVCRVCKQKKSLDQFVTHLDSKDGFARKCKECRNAYLRQRFAQNPELRKQRSKRDRKYYAANPEKKQAQYKKWVKANPEKRRIISRKYYTAHREKERARGRKYHAANPKKARIRMCKWRKANPEKAQAIDRKWRKANPDKIKAKSAQRRTQKTEAGGSYTDSEWQELCEKHGNCCVCCGEAKPLEADHIIPVNKGGHSNISNIQPLCRSCNASKGTQTIDYR